MLAIIRKSFKFKKILENVANTRKKKLKGRFAYLLSKIAPKNSNITINLRNGLKFILTSKTMVKSVFFFLRSISIFTTRSFLFVGKFKNKSQMGLAKLEKEINPSRNLKILAKKNPSLLLNEQLHAS